MAAKEFIVAIELGSSKVTGIAGQKSLDGSLNVLAVVKEPSSSFIRKGVVYNIDKTAQCLQNIIKKLETQLKTEITRVYVGVGGQSVRSVRNVIARDLPEGTIVTDEMIDTLVDANLNVKYTDQEILDTTVQEYRVDTQLQMEPAGIQCQHLEGNYLNILQRKTFYKNLNKCFESAGIRIADILNAPLALAGAVLTEAERRSGCVLVDLGADTTTVSVYYRNILRHLAVIPLGGANITKDIATLQLEEADAEKLKLQHASAYTDNNDIDPNSKVSIDADRTIETRRFVEIVEGRQQEIIENVLYQIPGEYSDKLLGGAVLTGGGANMKNIEKAFSTYTHIERVRIAKAPQVTVTSSSEVIKAQNAMMNTVLGLLLKGNANCAGDEFDPNGDLFGRQGSRRTVDDRRPARKPGEKPEGVVLTEEEKRQAEEERQAELERQRQLEKERLEAEAEAERKRKEEEERIRRENSLGNRLLRGIKRFTKSIVEEEE